MSWIPVEERLPEMEHLYFPVTFWGGKTGVARYSSKINEWYDVQGFIRHVIAWQPLPDPYQKPQRFMIYEDCILGHFEVWRTDVELVKGMPYGCATIAYGIPTREGAQEIADIYERLYA